jgi:hypothetical protein
MSQFDRVQLTELEKSSSRKNGATETASAESTTASPGGLNARQNAVLRMQQTHGNAAVQRMLVQRRVDAPAGREGEAIDDDVTSKINSARGSGQSLDSGVAQRMGEAMGADFSDVHVHNDGQSDSLNKDLSAKAFTTGNDIFFQQGAYQPESSSGQQLLAHELTHVVQQGGSAPSGPLTLGPAEDTYESEADSTASQVMSSMPTAAASAQRHADEEGDVQRAAEEDEEVQRQVMRAEAPEEEELLQG